MTRFGPITDYLPHRPPMLFIDEIVAETDDSVTCRAILRPDCILAENGVVQPAAMIELIAQVCAIYVGVKAAAEGKPPRVGFLIGCREVEFGVPAFAVGDELVVAATKVFGQTQMGAFAGTVSRAGAVCVRAHLSVVDADVTALPQPTGEAVDA